MLIQKKNERKTKREMQALSRWRVLVVVKPYDAYPSSILPGIEPRSVNFPQLSESSRRVSPRVLEYLDDRRRVHKEAIKLCQDALGRRPLEWKAILRSDLSHPIKDVDLVLTVGGDGTLLRTSHFLDGDIPVLGVNSDPTQQKEVEDVSNEFDARRSTGYLCAATADRFDEVLDEVLDGRRFPSNLSRISLSINDQLLPTSALNDVLIAHPCPASVSRFSFRIESLDKKSSSLVNCISSGLRVCTAAGSTAAMASAGGFPMPISSEELQYMVREPNSPKNIDSMHGLVKCGDRIHVIWYSREGAIYVDGSYVIYPFQHGDIVKISADAPALKVYLPQPSRP